MSARIKAIHGAAVSFFLRQGYARTQVGHIAGAVGVSVGTIYHDFAGKREIRDFVLKCAIDPGFIHREWEGPITGEQFIGLQEEIVATLEETAEVFARKLEAGAEEYPFEQLISDAFDLLAKYAVVCLYIEKNLESCGKLAEYYKEYRRNFFDAMTWYLSIYVREGVVRPLEHMELTTRLIVEMLAWWAMDMRYLSFETRDIPLELAKEICLDNIVHAYCKIFLK